MDIPVPIVDTSPYNNENKMKKYKIKKCLYYCSSSYWSFEINSCKYLYYYDPISGEDDLKVDMSKYILQADSDELKAAMKEHEKYGWEILAECENELHECIEIIKTEILLD